MERNNESATADLRCAAMSKGGGLSADFAEGADGTEVLGWVD